MGDLGGFETWMRSWGAADRTIGERSTTIAAALPAWGDPRTVTSQQLVRWLGNPAFAQWTRITYFYHARSYFAWLLESNQISVDPTAGMKAPKQPNNRPHPLTDADVNAALATARGNLRAWLLIGLLAGLRAHEIAKLRGEDVDERTLFVVGKGRQEAMIPTHPDLWGLARHYPALGWWFPSPRSASGHVAPESISTAVTRHFRRLGIEGSIHRTRHTYGTRLLRSGVNIRVVQTLMRHESLSTTAKYTAVDEVELTAAIRGLVA